MDLSCHKISYLVGIPIILMIVSTYIYALVMNVYDPWNQGANFLLGFSKERIWNPISNKIIL